MYPQIYEEKINKAAFMSSARIVSDMKKNEQGQGTPRVKDSVVDG